MRKRSEIWGSGHYLNLALDYLRDKQKGVGQEETAKRKSLDELYEACQARLKRLHDQYISPANNNGDLYSAEEFATLKKEIVAEREDIEKRRGKVREGLDHSLQETERVFNFCAFALRHFNTDDLQKKRTILSTMSGGITLTNKTIVLEKLHPFLLIEKELTAQQQLTEKLEHAENAPKANALQGVPAVLLNIDLDGDPGTSNKVRTSKNRSVKARPGQTVSTSGSLLRG